MKILWKSLFQVACSNVAMMGLSLISSILASRYLGTEGRGEMASVIVTGAIISALADGGITQAVPYFTAKQPEKSAIILGTSLFFSFTVGSILSLFASIILYASNNAKTSLLIYLISIPFCLVATRFSVFMQGLGKFKSYSIIRISQTAIPPIALIILIALERHSVSLLMTINVILYILVTIESIIITNRVSCIRLWRINKAMGYELIHYGLKSYIGNLFWLTNSRMDQFLMGIFLPLANLGIYSTAVSFSNVIFSIFGAFAVLTMTKAAATTSNNSISVIKKYLNTAILVVFPISVLMMLSTHMLLPFLFGKAFLKSIAPAMILIPASFLLGCNFLLSNGLRAMGFPEKPSISEAIGLIVSVLGLLWALPRYGIMGAAYVSFSSYFLTFIILIGMYYPFVISQKKEVK